MLPDFSAEKLRIILGKKRVSVALHESPSRRCIYMNKHAGMGVDPSKALTVPAYVLIAADPYTKTYEEKMRTPDILELESKPSIMFTPVKDKGRTVLPAQSVDP